MPRLYPSTPLRLARLRVGVQLQFMAHALGVSTSMLSNVERGLVTKPEIVAAMKKYLSARKGA